MPIIAGIAAGTVIATVLIILAFYSMGASNSGRQEENLAFAKPPNLIMQANGTEYIAAIGSYCGRNGCADLELETIVPYEVDILPRGSHANFTIQGYVQADIMTITFYNSTLEPINTLPSLNISYPNNSVPLEIPAGDYVFIILTVWDEPYNADASYVFRVRVV